MQITADITAAITDRVNQAVTDGKLTQERADQILGNLDDTVQQRAAMAQLSRGCGCVATLTQDRCAQRSRLLATDAAR